MGFNISEIVQGSAWKNFMKYLYAWGAAVVLLGALFKLQYWPGASIMLTIGMSVEVVIFFFSAFEPIHDEVDWTLVYPELAGMSDEEELRKYRKGSGMSGGIDSDDIREIVAGIVSATSSLPQAAPAKGSIDGQIHPGALVFTEKFNKMLENADISPELFDKLSKGLNKLSDTSAKLSDISDAAVATNKFTDNITKAGDSVANFTNSYQGSGQVLNESINILSESFQKTAGTISESGENFKGGMLRSANSFEQELAKAGEGLTTNIEKAGGTFIETGQTFMSGVGQSVAHLEQKLTNAGEVVSERIVSSGNQVAQQIGVAADNLTSSYAHMAEAMNANSEIITSNSNNYHQQLDKLNKNMSALNAAHELHLQGTTQRLKESESVYAGVDDMMKKLQLSIDQTNKYAESVALLNKNISSLNSIYGNMLSAMSMMSNEK